MFRRVYFNKETGAAIMTYSTNRKGFEKPSFGQDKKTYSHFDGMKDSVIDWIDLETGELERDFMEAASYKVNPETKEIEFSYREATAAEPISHQPPLSVQIKNLEARIAKLEGKTTASTTAAASTTIKK